MRLAALLLALCAAGTLPVRCSIVLASSSAEGSRDSSAVVGSEPSAFADKALVDPMLAREEKKAREETEAEESSEGSERDERGASEGREAAAETAREDDAAAPIETAEPHNSSLVDRFQARGEEMTWRDRDYLGDLKESRTVRGLWNGSETDGMLAFLASKNEVHFAQFSLPVSIILFLIYGGSAIMLNRTRLQVLKMRDMDVLGGLWNITIGSFIALTLPRAGLSFFGVVYTLTGVELWQLPLTLLGAMSYIGSVMARSLALPFFSLLHVHRILRLRPFVRAWIMGLICFLLDQSLHVMHYLSTPVVVADGHHPEEVESVSEASMLVLLFACYAGPAMIIAARRGRCVDVVSIFVFIATIGGVSPLVETLGVSQTLTDPESGLAVAKAVGLNTFTMSYYIARRSFEVPTRDSTPICDVAVYRQLERV